MADPDRQSCIVTGGGGGIGRAIALGLQDHGFATGVIDTDGELATEVAADLRQRGGTACAVVGDVTDPSSMAAAFEAVEEELGPVSVLFNNAGIPGALPLEAITEERFHAVMGVNVFGVIVGTQVFASRLRARGGGGKVINTCSVAGKRGIPGGSLYSASKFAVRALTQSHAMELAVHGITVNALCPGMVDTKIWDVMARDLDDVGAPRAGRLVEARNADIALGRHAEPHDVVGLALFLASPGADYITGQCINVDGGMVFD